MAIGLKFSTLELFRVKFTVKVLNIAAIERTEGRLIELLNFMCEFKIFRTFYL